MTSWPDKNPSPDAVPAELASVLWDVDPSTVSLARHRQFLIRRVLSRGTWAQIAWLRGRVGDDALRATIVRTHAKDLTRRQARFWQVILDLDEGLVTAWLDLPMRRLWEGRPQ